MTPQRNKIALAVVGIVFVIVLIYVGLLIAGFEYVHFGQIQPLY